MMAVLDELKKIEDAAQEIELWLFSHKKEVDEKRLEAYEVLRKVASIREREKSDYESRGGRGKKEGQKSATSKENIRSRESGNDLYER